MKSRGLSNFTQAKYDVRNDKRSQRPVYGRASAISHRKVDRGKWSAPLLPGRAAKKLILGRNVATEFRPNPAQKF